MQFLRKTIDLSCEYQSKLLNGMRVTYCGVEGAFAYMAAKRMFPEAELIPYSDFGDAYRAVERGEYDCVVLPLENSAAGEVGTVMDLIFSGDLFVNQVVDLPIEHNLLGVEGASLDGIKTVISHPQALEQCGEYIRAHGFETETFSNTALAAQYVKEKNDASVAAIASDETSKIFELDIIDKVINDSKINTTRFAALRAHRTGRLQCRAAPRRISSSCSPSKTRPARLRRCSTSSARTALICATCARVR